MQVKVNTGEKVYRFNQKGQLIDTITEPYVSVDTRTREDLEALYDSLHEHIATAFTYEGNSITGLAAEYVNAIQNFLLVEGAWYLSDLEDPSTDLEIKGGAEDDNPLKTILDKTELKYKKLDDNSWIIPFDAKTFGQAAHAGIIR